MLEVAPKRRQTAWKLNFKEANSGCVGPNRRLIIEKNGVRVVSYELRPRRHTNFCSSTCLFIGTEISDLIFS